MPRQTLKNKTQAEVDIIVAHENHCDELVEKYIPHFLDIWRNNKRRLQQSENGTPVETVSDTDVPSFLNAEGTYDAALQEEHDRQMQSQAYSDIIKNRSYNTTVTYGYRQIEFLLFCEKYYASVPLADRFQANEKTLLAFMMREIVERRVQKAVESYDEPKATVDISQFESVINNEGGKKLSYSTCNIYVCAVADLCAYQHHVGRNDQPSPRTKLITNILKIVRQREAKENRDNDVDRAIESVASGYTTVEQVCNISRKLINWNEQGYQYSFRNSLAFLLSHYLLLRGESIRNLELADLQFMELEKMKSNSTSYPAIICVFHQGKTNRFNKTESTACICNREVEACPFMAMALHFFSRYHRYKEPFPSLDCNKDWFKMKVIHGARPKCHIVKKVAKKTKKTKKSKGKGKQANRGKRALDDDSEFEDSSSNSEEEDDVAVPLAKKHLHAPISKTAHTRFMKYAIQAANIVVKNKLTHMPRICGARMASMAGVPEEEVRRQGRWNQDVLTNCYINVLPRQFIRAMAGFEKDSLYHLPRAMEEPCQALRDMVFPWVDDWKAKNKNGEVKEQSASASHFLALLTCFKTTLLQDAAVMMDLHPDHPIWKDPIFKTDLFLDFKRKVNSHVAANVIPQSVILTELAPEVQQEITALKTALDEQHSSVNSRLDATDNGVQQVLSIISGQQPLQLSVTLNGNLATSSNPSTNNIPSTSTATTSNIPIPAATTSSASNPRRFQANGVPDFKMSRGLTTVEQLHQEWYTSLGGDWPVAELEATWGTQWRLNDRKFVNIRRCVISAISDLENDLGLSTTAAIEQLQDVMARNNWSLHKLGVQLQNGNFYPCEVTKRRKLNQ